MNLFEIQANIDRILECAAENGGDIGESGAEELAISEEELGEKLYAYAFVIDRYNTDIALLKQYKQALDDRVKRTEKKIKRLKDVIAECAYKYGEPVLKKNTETGIKEPTGSMSLKYPNITISVRKGQEVVTDTEMFNSFLNQMYQYFENPSVDTVPANIDAIKGFIDVKLDKGLNLDKANKIKAILAEHGIVFEEGDFKFYVNSTNLKETLNQSPEGLDAWTLQEKDIVTIKK